VQKSKVKKSKTYYKLRCEEGRIAEVGRRVNERMIQRSAINQVKAKEQNEKQLSQKVLSNKKKSLKFLSAVARCSNWV
jgi:hypothetical protein